MHIHYYKCVLQRCPLWGRDKPSLCRVLRDYHTLIKVLPEIDQFAKGLDDVGVLKYVRKFPELMRPLFETDTKKRI